LLKIDSSIILVTVSLAFALTLTVVTNCTPTYAQARATATKLVHAGEGNASNVVVRFVPQTIEIKAGQGITWDNPTTVPEPHSVTFLKEKKYFADYAAPFQVVSSTEFQPLDPKSNSEPVFAPPSAG
jgi:plastocyanin